MNLEEFIKEKIRPNHKITRQAIVDEAGVSKKTIERYIKEIKNLKYVGKGKNGHWEVDELHDKKGSEICGKFVSNRKI